MDTPPFDPVSSTQMLAAFLCWLICLLLKLFQMEAHRQNLLERARAVDDATLSAEACETSVYEAVLLKGREVSTVIALAVQSMEQAGALKRAAHPDSLTFCDAFAVGPGTGAVALDALQKRILAHVEESRGLAMFEITRDVERSPEIAGLQRRVLARRHRLLIEVPFWESMPHGATWRRFQGALRVLVPRTLRTPNQNRFMQHWYRWHGPLPTETPVFDAWLEEAERWYSYI